MSRLPGIQVALLACTMALTGDIARAQSAVGAEIEASGIYGADYFTADQDPKIQSWLALVEKGHVNQRVWNSFHFGQYNAALDDTRYALDRFPNHPRALGLLGEIGKATGDVALPITYYEQALKQYPQHAFTHAQYGQFLVDIGAVGAGASELRRALQLDPNLVSALAWLRKIEPVSAPLAPAGDSTATGRAGSGSR